MKKSSFSVRTYTLSPKYYPETVETFKDIDYYKPVIYTNVCRYKNLRTLMDDDGKIYHESWNQKFVDYTAGDQYYTITKVEENRLDMVSLKFYDTPRYWWAIALANYLIDPFDVPVGTNLRIPPILSLYNEGGVLGG